MLQKRPTYEELLKETMTHRLKIIPERQRRTQQGLLIEDVDFDDFDLNNYYKKALTIDEATQTNEEKGTQTDFIDEGSSNTRKYMFDSDIRDFKSTYENRRDKMTQTVRYLLTEERGTQTEGTDEEDDDSYIKNHWTFNRDKKDKSTQTFKYKNKERNPTDKDDNDDNDNSSRLSDLAQNALGLGLYTAYQGGRLALNGVRLGMNLIDSFNERDSTSEEEREPTPRIIRRGASRSRSASVDVRQRSRSRDEEMPSGSNDAIRLLRRGASRSRSPTPDKKNRKRK